MNEKKKSILVLVSLFSIIGIIILFGLLGGESSKDIYERFADKLQGEEVALIYIGKSTCPACNLFSPVLEEMKGHYEFEEVYINTDKMSNKYMNQIMADLDLTKIGTPYLLVVKNGAVIATQEGYDDYDTTFEFLQENGIIDENKINYQKEIYEEFTTLLNSSKEKLIYIGRPTCQYCQLLYPSLEEMKERYDFEFLYINTDEIMTEYMNKIITDLEITSVTTPYLLIVKNGEVVETQNGYLDYDQTFEFLQENGIIAKKATLALNYIGLEEYKAILNGSKPEVVIIGQSTCGYCVHARLILNEIADKNDININYLNISYLTNEEGQELESSIDYFKSNQWGTPLAFILKEGKVIDVLEGYTTLENYVSFFERNEVM